MAADAGGGNVLGGRAIESTWQCSACTVVNEARDSVCSVCHTPRPARAPAAPSQTGDDAGAEDDASSLLARLAALRQARRGVGVAGLGGGGLFGSSLEAILAGAAGAADGDDARARTRAGSSRGAAAAAAGGRGASDERGRGGGDGGGDVDLEAGGGGLLRDGGGAGAAAGGGDGEGGGDGAAAAADGPLGAAAGAGGIMSGDVRAALVASRNYLPFLLLLLFLFLHNHLLGIATFAVMTLCLAQLNSKFKHQVALKENHQRSVLALVVALAVMNGLSVYVFFRQEELWRYLVMDTPLRGEQIVDAGMASAPHVRGAGVVDSAAAGTGTQPISPPADAGALALDGGNAGGTGANAVAADSTAGILGPDGLPPLTLWEVLWFITANDIVLRFGSIAVKAAVALAPCACSFGRTRGPAGVHRRKRHMYGLLDLAFALVRSLLSTPLWLRYYLGQGPGDVFANGLAGAYILMKSLGLFSRGVELVTRGREFVAQGVAFGRRATAAEVATAGDPDCSICQERLSNPVVLGCGHIFDEECVGEWLDRERTCPICRGRVATAGRLTEAEGTGGLLTALF